MPAGCNILFCGRVIRTIMRNTICILLFVFLCSLFTSVTLAAGPPDVQKLQREINVLRIEMARPNRPEKQLQMLRSHLARVDFQIQSMMKDAANDEQLQKLADSVRKLRGDRKPNAIPRTPAAPPANDNCENAQVIMNGTSGSTLDATVDGSSSCDIASSPDVWFDYQASSTGIFSINTLNSNYWTLISIHSACPGSESNQIACNGGAFGNESQLFVSLFAGSHYKLRVSARYGDSGDFSLQVGQPGSISGTITDSQTQAPLDLVDVTLWDLNGDRVTATTSDPAGNFIFTQLAPGTYFAITDNNSNYIDELYDNIPCPSGCDVTTGTPIVVSPSSNSIINFALDHGGSFSGTVTDASTGAGLPDSEIVVYDQDGNFFSQLFPNSQGQFVAGGLPAGTYFATAGNAYYIEELYNNIPCPCNPPTGTPISVTVDHQTPNIDFALDRGGIISGTVADSASNPILNVYVAVIDSNGNNIASAQADILGQYAIGGLQSGNYFVLALGLGVYVNELYDNIPCPSNCDPTSGTPVPVTVSNTTPGIDFVLSRLGSISGQVVDSLFGLPLPNIEVLIYDLNSNQVSYAETDFAGNYVAHGLVSGDYHAVAFGWDQHLSQIFSGILCSSFCDPALGAAIPVIIDTNTSGIDFALDPGGSVSGTITDAITGDPLKYIHLSIYDSNGEFAGSAYTDYNGFYIVGTLMPGSYYIRTTDGYFHYYVDELYDNIPCLPQCNLNSGTPVAVTLNTTTTGIDFGLDKTGSFGGTVTDEISGLPIQRFYLNIYDANGNYFQSAQNSDSFGHYVVRGLPPGSYLITCEALDADFEYTIELYNNHPCDNCDVTTGDMVPVTLASYTSGIDFSLQRAQQSLFADDFDDGVLDSAWTYDKGTWVESGGFLQGTATKGASALATPFAGCSSCTVEAVLQSGGGTGNRVWLLGWYQDKGNFVELMMKQEAGKWILKQHAGGMVVSKGSFASPTSANVPYAVKIVFDGTAFGVYIDNVFAFSVPNRAPSLPQGTVGFQLKKTTGSFGSILVYE